MDLRLTEDQAMLKRTAADFMRTEAPTTSITGWLQEGVGFVPSVYRTAADLGWLGMLVPEGYGGVGASLGDCAVIFEELGRGPLPGPFFSSGVLGAAIIQEGGTDEQKQRLLPALCKGEAIATLAVNDRGYSWGPGAVEMEASDSPSELTLHGTKMFVHDAGAATVLICAVKHAGGISLVLVDMGQAGVSVAPYQGLVPPSLGEVRLDEVRVPKSEILGEPGQGWAILESAMMQAIPVLCAYKVGACQEVFDFTVEYTKSRVVFGQPIGRFQRVQDHVVDLVNHLDSARWITNETLWKLDDGVEAISSVHEAKAVASDAYYQACNFAHMVFAGPGTDYLHPLVGHMILSRSLYQYLGNPLYHKRKMMDCLFPRKAEV
jgi:alkylation response protein AidB-like acyl-CoA dehydrogenase